MQTVSPVTSDVAPTARRKLRQPIEVINIPNALLTRDVVLSVTGLSKSSWYRMIAAGEAPAPLRHGSRCSRWVAKDVIGFLEARAKKAGAQ